MICMSEAHVQSTQQRKSESKDEPIVVSSRRTASKSAEAEAMQIDQTPIDFLQSAQPAPSSSSLVEEKDLEHDTDLKVAAIKISSRRSTSELASPPLNDLLFRCSTCTRAAHYACITQSISTWQIANDWQCTSCTTWEMPDAVLAWRPIEELVKAPTFSSSYETLAAPITPSKRLLPPKNLPSYKEPSEMAEYLVKFKDKSFRHVEWVPHAWLFATYPQRLRGFLTKGPSIDIATDMSEEIDGQYHLENFSLAPNLDAINGIPKEWITPDRILEVEYHPKRGLDLISSSNLKSLSNNPVESLDRIARIYVKWQGLAYESCMSSKRHSY